MLERGAVHGGGRVQFRHDDGDLPSSPGQWPRTQVINTLLEYYTRGKPAATFRSNTKVTEQEWGYDKIASEASLFMRRGYLCHGTIDKAQYGKGGLLHAVQVCPRAPGGPQQQRTATLCHAHAASDAPPLIQAIAC